MSEMVKRGARAIKNKDEDLHPYASRHLTDEEAIAFARAVIEAMREPTSAMLAALSDAIADGVSDERKIQAVVDAALVPKKSSRGADAPDLAEAGKVGAA